MQGSIAFDGTLSGSIAGGGGGGSEVTITPTLTSGTKIADYEIDGIPDELFAPSPEALTAQAPLSISSGVISIDLSNYPTNSDLNNYQEKLTAGNNITIDAQNEISATVPTVSASQIQTTGTHIADITIDNTTTEIFAPSGSSWDYSTNEVDTGQKWIDGSTIYCRVVHYATPLQIPNGWVKAINVTDESWTPVGVSYAVDDSTQGTTPLVTDFDDNDGLFVSNLRNVTFNASEVVCFYIKNS